MQLIDSFGRVHTNLRVSVTDRCNIRCFYCMPEHVEFLPRKEILTFEEMTRVVKVAAELGVNKLRITGGEPLVRKNIDALIRQLKQINGINEIALTTNAVLLDQHAKKLRDAGLDRLNISLDSLDPGTYHQITRRHDLPRVLQGIEAAGEAGFENTKINAVAIRSLSEDSILPLAHFCLTNSILLRFIEFMPLDGDQNWSNSNVLPGQELIETLETEFGPARVIPPADKSQPATDYKFEYGGTIGFINSVTAPFCSSCNRLRLTAEGKFRNCLFSTEDFDLREILRSQRSDKDLKNRMLQCVAAKKSGHGINSDAFQRPERAMYQIGG